MADKYPLPVIFRMFRGELCAYFPTLEWSRNGDITCYAHVGQHGGASIVWLSKGRPAKPEEYASLLAELQGIYRKEPYPVELKVYRRAPRRGSHIWRAHAIPRERLS